MNVAELSMTQKNVFIDKLAVFIEETRIVLNEENENYVFSERDSRRIILLVCMYLQLQETDIVCNRCCPIMLADLMNVLGMEWTEQFLECKNYNQIRIEHTLENFSRVYSIDNWRDLLGYSLEVLEYAPKFFLSMPMKRGIHIGNEKKKNLGIYYTPRDVVKFMLDKCFSSMDILQSLEDVTILDCSCGTGVFLIAAIKELISSNMKPQNIKEIIEKSIWGIDKSEVAVDNTKIMLLTELCIIQKKSVVFLPELWKSVNKNIVCGDATEMDKILKQHPYFPKQYSCLIGNPPYVTEKNKGNLFLEFVRNMMEYGNENSCSALIVPLSICYSQSTPFKTLRNDIFKECNIEWSFYNFDRSPDSLFGDQVKTRNTILFRKKIKGESILKTTGLQRWTNEKRKELFMQLKTVEFDKNSNQNVIPKISTETQKKLYDELSIGNENILSMASGKGKYQVCINATAYNWLCVYDHVPPSFDEYENLYIPASMKILNFDNEEQKYFFIAMLSNRIAYWYWTVLGDGFHLNTSFLENLYISEKVFNESTKMELAKLGKIYCKELKKYPTKSYNCKKCIVNYNHLPLEHLYSKIELIILDRMKVPSEFENDIKKWYSNQVLCGRKIKGAKI